MIFGVTENDLKPLLTYPYCRNLKPFISQVQKDVLVNSPSSIHRQSKEVTKIENTPLQSKLMRLTTGGNGRSEGTSNHLSPLSKYFLDSSLTHSVFNSNQIFAFGLRDVLMNLSQVIAHCFQQNLFTSSSRLLLRQRLEELSSGVGVRNRDVYMGLIELNQTVERSICLYKKNIELYSKTVGVQENIQSAKVLHSLCDALLNQCSSMMTVLSGLKGRLGNKEDVKMKLRHSTYSTEYECVEVCCPYVFS